MTLLGLAIISLATWQIGEIWHHGSLFSGWRARVETWEGWLAELLLCPFCLSVWIGVIVSILYAVGGYWVEVVLAGLVASRVANAANDLMKAKRSQPTENTFEEDDDDDDDASRGPRITPTF